MDGPDATPKNEINPVLPENQQPEPLQVQPEVIVQSAQPTEQWVKPEDQEEFKRIAKRFFPDEVVEKILHNKDYAKSLFESLKIQKDNTSRAIAQLLEAVAEGKTPENWEERLAQLTTQAESAGDQSEAMQALMGMERIPREVMELLKEPEKHIDELENWIRRLWIKVDDTGTRYGSSENQNDAQVISYIKSRLPIDILDVPRQRRERVGEQALARFKRLRKEIDTFHLWYDHDVGMRTADKFESAYSDISQVRAEHLSVMFNRPEVLFAFWLFEKYSDPKNPNLNILTAKGAELEQLRNRIKKELKDKLQQTGQFAGSSLDYVTEIGFRFGEHFWRSMERAAKKDITCRGSGEFHIRRLLQDSEYLKTAIEDGEIKGKPEIAARYKTHVPDYLSSKSESFWLGDFDQKTKMWGRRYSLDIDNEKTTIWDYEKTNGSKIIFDDGRKPKQWYEEQNKAGVSIIYVPDLTNLPDWVQKAINKGAVRKEEDNQLVVQDAEKFGDDLAFIRFPGGQRNKEVREWYKKAKAAKDSQGRFTIIDNEGIIWDLTSCPLDKIDYTYGLTNPNAGLMVGHAFKDLGFTENLRKAVIELVSGPDDDKFVGLKKIDISISTPWYTDEKLKERESDEGFNEGLSQEETAYRRFKKYFKQEIITDLALGYWDWLKKYKLASPASFAHFIEKLSPKSENVIGEKERQSLFKYVFPTIPYWFSLAFGQLEWGGAFLVLISKILGLKIQK